MNEKVIVLDFGGQYAQLIARRVREAGVYCEILPSTVKTEVLRQMPELKGIIFTGGPASVYEPDSPDCDKDVYNIGVPVLGICYGAQLIIKHFGGRVEHTEKGEYGKKEAVFEKCRIFDGVAASQIWMSHRDQVVSLPEGFKAICHTDGCPISAYTSGDERIVGLQFHPEVVHTVDGKRMMENFLVKVCGCKCDCDPGNLIDEYIADIKKTVGWLRYKRNFGRRRFVGRVGAGSQSRRRTAHLHICRSRPFAQKRGSRGLKGIPRQFRP